MLSKYESTQVDGKQVAVRNGRPPERSIQAGLGDIAVKVPKVRDRSGQGIKFNSLLRWSACSVLITVSTTTAAIHQNTVEQFEFFDIGNPCIGVCENGPNGMCKGCFRKREERQYWHRLNNDVKRRIVQACALRKRRAVAARTRAQEGDEAPTAGQQELF